MKLYSVDDGASHTVVAEDQAQAVSLYVRSLVDAGSDWPEVQPAVHVLDPSCEYPIKLGEAEVRLTGHQWLTLLSVPQYLACSEF